MSLLCVAASLLPSALLAAWDVEVVETALSYSFGALARRPGGGMALALTGTNVRFGTWNGSGWALEPVSESARGRVPSLAFDGSGEPALAFEDASVMRIARRAGGIWTSEVFDPAVANRHHVSLAFDGSGSPAIAYVEGNRPWSLKLARWSGSAWDIQVIDPQAIRGSLKLRFDRAGLPLIAYSGDGVDWSVRLARWTGSSWRLETVADRGNEAWLALDVSDQPVVSYHDYVRGGVYVARWSGSLWTSELVDPLGFSFTSLDSDPSGKLVMAYQEGTTITNRRLKVARHDGSAWTSEVADGTPQSGWSPQLEVDSQSAPWVVSSTFDTGILQVTRWTGSAWSTEAISTRFAAVGATNALALAPTGDLAACWSYSTNTGTSLHYGLRESGSWKVEAVSQISDTSQPSRCSLVFDGLGRACIATVDVASHRLLLFRRNGASWDRTEIADAFAWASMVLAPDGFLWIAHSGYPARSLQLSRESLGGWITELVDPAVVGANDPQLVLDRDGHPVIGYGDIISPNRNPFVARHDGSIWTIEKLRTSNGIGAAAVATDAQGRIWAASGDWLNDQLWLSVLDGGTWSHTLVPAGATELIDNVRIQLDTQGEPRISYVDWGASTGTAWLASRQATVWSFETIGSGHAAYGNLLAAAGCSWYGEELWPNYDFVVYHETGCASAGHLYRATVAATLPGWKPAVLPLSGLNDEELTPFPIAATSPGLESDALASAAPLVLYRYLGPGDAVVSSVLFAVKRSGRTEIVF